MKEIVKSTQGVESAKSTGQGWLARMTKKRWVAVVALLLCFVFAGSVGLRYGLSGKQQLDSREQRTSIPKIDRQMLDEQYNLVLQEHQVADLNEEQQGILEQGVQYLEDFYQALEENKTTDELFDILSQGLYDFSAYISSLYDYGTPSTRGQIRIILSIDFQKAFMNFIAGSVGALLGATGMFTTLVSMLVAATLPVAWIPVVGQAITIAVVALATFLAAYFWDKYVTSNMRFENMYWNVAKGLFVPNFDLWI